MEEVLIEVLGTEPPCARCNQVLKTVKRVVNELSIVNLKIEKRNLVDKDTVKRFGVITPPALAINGVVKVAGRIPSESEIKELITSLKAGSR